MLDRRYGQSLMVTLWLMVTFLRTYLQPWRRDLYRPTADA
jgi:hypothetical protein